MTQATTGPDECPFCGADMKQHEHCFAHPRNVDCILAGYSFDNDKIGQWNERYPDEYTRMAGATYRQSQED